MQTTQTKETISYYRDLILFSESVDAKPRDVYDFLEEHGISLTSLKLCYRKEYISDITDDVFEHDGRVYDSDIYCITIEDEVINQRDASWCEYNNGFTSEEIVTVHLGRRGDQNWRRSDAEDDSYEYQGEYYTDLDYYGLVRMHNGNIEHQDYVHYWESDGCYHYEEERDLYVRDYHSGDSVRCTWSPSPKFLIGFEIEKEDRDVKESIEIQSFERKCSGWRKERDGSLDDESGYELISPTFELDVDKIWDSITSDSIILNHINAKYSTDCGGHINVSERNLSGQELFDKIKGYNPLFYALYYKRVDINYCKGKSNKDLVDTNEKYQAIRIHSNRIEYRIISAVPDAKTLIWRTKLINYIVNNPTSCIKTAFFNCNTSELKDLLLEMYPGDKFNILMRRLITYSLKFENTMLK